jgi:hypothetical protein
LLEPQVLDKVGSDFLNQLEGFLNHSFDPFTSFNNSLFFFSKNRFLHLEKKPPISLKGRITRLFTKNYWKRRSYMRNISNFSIEFGFYLAFLSEFLNSDYPSIHLYLSHLNQINDSETGAFNALNTLFVEYLTQLKEDNHILEKDEIPELTALIGPNLDLKEKETDESKSLSFIGELSKEKPNKLVKNVRRSNRAKMMGNSDLSKSNIENEKLLLSWKGSLKLRHRTYRSNLSTRGNFILTTKRLIVTKRKFGLFSFIPMIAYVRPNNRAMIIIMKIGSFLNRFRQVLSGMIKGAAPGAIVAIVSFPILNKFFISVSNIFPSVEIPLFSSIKAFAVSNPQGFAVIIGVLGGFSFLIPHLLRLILFRSKSLTVVPLSLFTDLSSSTRRGSHLQMVWKPVGSSKLPKLSEGLPFHLRASPRDVKGVPKESSIQRINLSLAALLASRRPD